MANETHTTALAPFEPNSLSEAIELSNRVSEATLLPPHLRKKPADVLVSIMAGRELGLSPMQSLRGMHVIEGKPTMSADLMVAIALRHRDVCEYFQLVESTDKIATFETKRAGAKQPTRMSYKIEQAQRAGLAGKANWKNHTEAMLRARASSALARTVYPDLLAGVYDYDEVGARPPIDATYTAEPEREPQPPVDNDHVAPSATPFTEAEIAANAPPSATTVILDKITAAGSQVELDALIPEIKTQPVIQVAALRARFVQRMAELANGHAASAGAA